MPRKKNEILVGIVMGSQSDWVVMKETKSILDELSIENECRIISAHRTPDRMNEYGSNAQKRGLKVIIAGAGGAAHLPGMLSSHSSLPIIGVPIDNTALKGIDSLLSIVQMPNGVPVATMSIGEPGAKNAAIFAAKILSLHDEKIKKNLFNWKKSMTQKVPMYPK